MYAICNVLVLMKCLDVEAMFGYLCNIQVFMQRSGGDAMVGYIDHLGPKKVIWPKFRLEYKIRIEGTIEKVV